MIRAAALVALVAGWIVASGCGSVGAQLPSAPLPIGFLSDPNCETCAGLGVVPDPKAKPYVVTEDLKTRSRRSRADFTSQPPIAGKFCPHCLSEDLDEVRAESMLLDQTETDSLHEAFEAAVGPLIRVHTRYVTIHTQLPPLEANRIGVVVETLAAHLQKTVGSMKLTPTRADNYDSVSLIGRASYLKFLEFFAEKYPNQARGRDWDLLQNLAGSTRNRIAFFHEIPQHKRHPVHFTVFQFGRFTVNSVSRFEAPEWAVQGFAAYCEYIALRQNRCYTIAYDLKDMTLRGNWVENAQKLARAGQLTEWDSLMTADLRTFKPRDYLSAFVAVYFLMDVYPTEYVEFLETLGDGTKPREAFETAFGKSVEEMESERGRWLLKRRG